MTGPFDRLLAAFAPTRYRQTLLRRLIADGVVSLGAHSYGAPSVLRFTNDDTKLSIGSYTSIGPGVQFVLGGNHPLDRVTTFPIRERLGLAGAGLDGYPHSRGDITVGSDVWIGTGATILSGVSVGDGAVVGAGSLVTRDIAPFDIAWGVPARHQRFRFSEEVITRLLELRWWEWSANDVVAVVDLLSGPVINLPRLEAFAADRPSSTRR